MVAPAAPAPVPPSTPGGVGAVGQAGPVVPIEGFTAVVPAGGAGTRLWPLSRAGAPKFLHDLTGAGRSLLQSTYDRLAPLAGGRVLLVTGADHAAAVRQQLPELAEADVLLEPSPRDSMAAIGLAAAVLEAREGPGAVLGSFAADHAIPATESEAFADAVAQAVAAARAGYVVTIGIAPTGPATGFGYVRAGDPLEVAGAPTASLVAEFVEKPDAVRAAEYVAGGAHRWNAGMFVVSVGVLLDHLAEQLPPLAAGLREIAAAWDSPGRDAALAQRWSALTKIAIDHAIAEPVAAAGGVAVVPGSFAWDDVGDWDSLADLLPAAAGLAVLGDRGLVHATGTNGVVVPAAGRAVSVVGIEGAVVVDTPDALLVTTRAHAQEVKGVVESWRAAGRHDLL